VHQISKRECVLPEFYGERLYLYALPSCLRPEVMRTVSILLSSGLVVDVCISINCKAILKRNLIAHFYDIPAVGASM